MLCFTISICVLVAPWCQATHASDLEFKVVPIRPASRIDALAYLGKGVVLAGTRNPHPGYVHKSEDYGASWRNVGDITGSDFVTCLCSGTGGVAYLLTGKKVHVWKTADYGETWQDLGRISHASNPHYANAYGMVVTAKGTVLVADADSKGGHIHRSTNGGRKWQDVGRISTRALYRLIAVGDGVIANGWAGHIYKSADDGVTWRDMGRLMDSDLYAIEYLGGGLVLIGTKSGHVFVSRDNGETWKNQGIVGASADDFARLGDRRVLYSTYAGDRSLYISSDAGTSWTRLGPVPTGKANDWLDHVITIDDHGAHFVVGGTNKGSILHSRLKGE